MCGAFSEYFSRINVLFGDMKSIQLSLRVQSNTSEERVDLITVK